MKNLVKLFAVVFMFSMCLTSCEKDEDVTQKSDVVSLSASFNTNANIAKASKSGPQRVSSNLNRGTIPACVSGINVLSHSTAGDINNLFSIIESTDEATSTALIKAYLGQNKFTATTPNPIFDAPVAADLAGKDVDQLRAYLKSLRPYAVFTSEVDQMITEAQEPLSFNMTTLNGRMSMVFAPEAGIVNHYNLKVLISKGDVLAQEITITSTGAVNYFYWSNAECINGKTLSLTVKFFAKSDSSYANALKTLNQNSTDNSDLLVVGGEGHNMKVTISKSNIIVESIPSTFIFQEVENKDTDMNL